MSKTVIWRYLIVVNSIIFLCHRHHIDRYLSDFWESDYNTTLVWCSLHYKVVFGAFLMRDGLLVWLIPSHCKRISHGQLRHPMLLLWWPRVRKFWCQRGHQGLESKYSPWFCLLDGDQWSGHWFGGWDQTLSWNSRYSCHGNRKRCHLHQWSVDHSILPRGHCSLVCDLLKIRQKIMSKNFISYLLPWKYEGKKNTKENVKPANNFSTKGL